MVSSILASSVNFPLCTSVHEIHAVVIVNGIEFGIEEAMRVVPERIGVVIRFLCCCCREADAGVGEGR